MKGYATVKRLLVVYVILGVWIGCFAFVMALFVGAVRYGGANAYVSAKTGEGLVQLAIYYIILSTSVCVAGLIYLVENLSIGLKGVFQMTVMAVVNFVEAYFFGWIEESGLLFCICRILGVAVVSWLLIMAAYLVGVNRINRKIWEKNQKDSDDRI